VCCRVKKASGAYIAAGHAAMYGIEGHRAYIDLSKQGKTHLIGPGQGGGYFMETTEAANKRIVVTKSSLECTIVYIITPLEGHITYNINTLYTV
jgi:hypothetical protein